MIIVAGNAWTLHEDLGKAKKYGELPIIAVNGASKEVKAEHLYSQHPERLLSMGWIRYQRRFHSDFTVHAPGNGDLSYVDHWWQIKKTGGSAWGARKLATLLGFKYIILCGCPMETGPYVGNHNLGGLMYKTNVVKDLQDQIASDKEWHKGCISMSGFTKDLLGDSF